MKKTIISIGIVVAVFAAVGYKLQANKKELQADIAFAQERTTVIPVKVAEVKFGALESGNKTSGTLQAEKIIPVIAEYSGKITALFVEQGSTVQQGQIIAQIDNSALSTAMQTARANVEKSELDYKRMQVLVENNVKTKNDLEMAELRLSSAKSDLDKLQTQWDNAMVVAPASGVLYKLSIEKGQFAGAGQNLGILASMDEFKLPVYADEKTAVNIIEEQPVQVQLNVDIDLLLNGTVRSVSKVAEDNGTFAVDIRLANVKPDILRAGMTATVQFVSPENRRLLIPRASVVGSLKSPVVYVVNGGEVTETKLTLGKSNGVFVEVLQGLKEGEQVVLSGHINLQDGTQVRVL